jgi:hypothetical protein
VELDGDVAQTVEVIRPRARRVLRESIDILEEMPGHLIRADEIAVYQDLPGGAYVLLDVPVVGLLDECRQPAFILGVGARRAPGREAGDEGVGVAGEARWR